MTNKVRPLGAFSDFVVDELPAVLKNTPHQLPAGCLKLLHPDMGRWEISERFGEKDRLVAALDLKIAELAIVHSQLPVPQLLCRLVEAYSTGLPMLLYEEIILANPVSDMRTFTCGGVGKTEAMFYYYHAVCELHLSAVILAVQDALSAHLVHHENLVLVASKLKDIEHDLDIVLARMNELGDMTKGYFAAFRGYLSTHPTRGLKGPSGAFSPGFALLEVLLRGDTLPDEYGKYLVANREYFPQQGEPIAEALHTTKTCGSLKTIADAAACPALTERVDVIARFFNDFRQIHLKSLHKQIPEAVCDEVAGTGGEAKPGTFLRQRIAELRLPTNGGK